MISTIASSYEAAADLRSAEPHCAWRRAWERLREDCEQGKQVSPGGLAEYVAEVPLEDQRDCLCDLIGEHLRLYSRAGEPQLEDYCAALGAAFPWLLDSSSLPASLIEDEFIVRSTPPNGDYPRLANYFSRFGNRPDVHERLARRCLADQRYIKLRVLGIGALGVVYEAYDSVADRLVAVKEVAQDDAEASPRLVVEMQLAAELNHPGIVQVYDSGQSDLGVFYVMELVAGQSLSERIADYHGGRTARSAAENRRQFRFLIECVIQLCEATAHAHERGILHRDLKPGNVLVRETGEAVLVDWGLARRVGPKRLSENPHPSPLPEGEGERHPHPGSAPEREEVVVGTPQYMAPEQVERQESQASDIFSLGATLYEVLTGHPPYEWRGDFLPPDWQDTVRQARIASPRRLVSSTPRQLDKICMKALAKAPEDRYAVASELAADLRQYVSSEQQLMGWLDRIRMHFR